MSVIFSLFRWYIPLYLLIGTLFLIYLFIVIKVRLQVSSFVCTSIHLSIYLSSLHSSVHSFSIHLSSIYTSICPFIVHLSIHPSIHLSIHRPSIGNSFLLSFYRLENGKVILILMSNVKEYVLKYFMIFKPFFHTIYCLNYII